MQVWTSYIISMPSGGLVANHNRNQCITSTLGWRKFTVNTRRESRHLSCSYHVRLSGGNLQSFGDPPFAWHLSSPETRNSHSNLKSLGVRDDETPRANPRPRLPGWIRFTPGVSSWRKSISLTETQRPGLFWAYFAALLATKGTGQKTNPERQKRIQGLLGFRF
jgi:hypothetical protein